MKNLFLIVLSLVFTTIYSMDDNLRAEIRERVKKNVLDCAKTEGATDGDLSEIMGLKVPESHAGKCVFFCMHKKYNFQNADGTLNLAGANNTLDVLRDINEETTLKLIAAINSCSSVAIDSDPCISAINIYQCFHQKASEAGVIDVIIK